MTSGRLAQKCHITWNISEKFGRFVHGFEGIVNVLLDDFSVNRRQRVVHPRLVPAQPVRHGDPQVAERLELLHQLAQLIVLKPTTHLAYRTETNNTPSLSY